MSLSPDLLVKVDQLIKVSQESFKSFLGDSNCGRYLDVETRMGRKYLKIINRVIMHPDDKTDENGWTVWCFVDKQGNIYKPATFHKPVKNARYSLANDESFTTALKRADWAGKWLYVNKYC